MSRCVVCQEGDDDDSEGDDKLLTSHADADTTIVFTTGEGESDFLIEGVRHCTFNTHLLV